MLKPSPSRHQKTKLLIALTGIFFSSQSIANIASTEETLEQGFEWVIEAVDGISRKHIHSGDFYSPQLLQSAYEANSYRPLWSEKLEDPEWLNDVISSLEDLRWDALPVSRYHLDDIKRLQPRQDKHWLLDMHISDALLTAISDLNGNLVPPEVFGPKWKLRNDPADPLALLEQIRRFKPASETLDSQRPRHAQYARLRNALKEFDSNRIQGPIISEGEKLVPGDSGERVYQLAQRMAAEGLLNGDHYYAKANYDEELVTAVKKFQKLRGLKVDGIVGRSTRKAINTSPDDIALKISLNLQRWRSAPKTFPDRHILVNTPAYKMELYDDGVKAMEMDVVVGKSSRQTPSFTETMTSLVLNPNWNIPKRITTEEILPKLREDPDYAIQANIRALIGNKHIPWSEIAYEEFWADEFPYRLQQTSGSKNALGRYKFMLPNPYLVYLHDTPYKGQFSKHSRAYSRGCIRLSKPNKLATYLLTQQGWSESKVKQVVNQGKRRMIALDKPVQVYMMYLTSWVNDEGDLELYPDVYRHDKTAKTIIASILKEGDTSEGALSVASID